MSYKEKGKPDSLCSNDCDRNGIITTTLSAHTKESLGRWEVGFFLDCFPSATDQAVSVLQGIGGMRVKGDFDGKVGACGSWKGRN